MKGLLGVIVTCGLAPLCSLASPVLYELSSMHSHRAAHTATRLLNDSVLIVGGFMSEEDRIAGSELFDPSTRRFQSIAAPIVPRQSHTATLLRDGRVLIVGGYGSRVGSLDTTEIFDPATRTFTRAGRLHAARAEHIAIALDDGRIALIGGRGTDWTTLDSIEIYDPNADAFTKAGRMTVPRTGIIAVLLRDGRILIAGGHTGRGASIERYDSAEIFDPSTGKSERTADMGRKRDKHDGLLLADGRVLLTGGVGDEERLRDNSAEIFDPVSARFTPVSNMHLARYKHRGSSVLLPNGMVLIAGGAARAEIYNPATDKFALVDGATALSGSFSVATPLDERRVLITGGYARPDRPSREAWVYGFE